MMDFNGYSLTLYRNGNYQWKNWVFGMANYQWGRYTMKNDTVQLDVDSLENIVQTNKLLITKGHLFDTTVNEELCEQLCDSGKWAETMRVVRP
ncbi:MAG: hypothetical protein EBZ77_10750 [Chitinophagia bacterium]|nr:hypothetical protein [Chitinophagia bacterium]